MICAAVNKSRNLLYSAGIYDLTLSGRECRNGHFPNRKPCGIIFLREDGLNQRSHGCGKKAHASIMGIVLLNRLSARKSLVALVLLGILVGFGNAGAVVVCLGEDGHIEVVPASGEHCCECPSNATVHDPGHPCGSCFDIPLPLGSGREFLPPAGIRIEEFKGKAELTVSSGSLGPTSPGLSESAPAGILHAGHIPSASLSTVVLLI